MYSRAPAVPPPKRSWAGLRPGTQRAGGVRVAASPAARGSRGVARGAEAGAPAVSNSDKRGVRGKSREGIKGLGTGWRRRVRKRRRGRRRRRHGRVGGRGRSPAVPAPATRGRGGTGSPEDGVVAGSIFQGRKFKPSGVLFLSLCTRIGGLCVLWEAGVQSAEPGPLGETGNLVPTAPERNGSR